MEWDDRDWAWQEDEPEWEGRDGPAPVRGSNVAAVRASVLIVLVALGAAACVTAGQLPRHHPLVPAFSFALPQLGSRAAASPTTATSAGAGRQVALGGPPVAANPSTYTLHGRTASTDGLPSTGKVVLHGRWNDGPWLVLDRTRTDAAGNFEVQAPLHRNGVLELRLLLPDGFVGTKTIHVG